MFLFWSATSSGAAASMATASVLSMAFMVITPIGSGMQQREKRQGLLPAPAGLGSKGDSGFQLAQAIGQTPQGAVQAPALAEARTRVGEGRSVSERVAPGGGRRIKQK